MLRWIYNLITPAPAPRFGIGSLVGSSKLLQPGTVVARRLQQVRYGRRWNEETRGWMYQIGDTWFNEDFLDVPIITCPPDLSDAELQQVRVEIRTRFSRNT